MFIDHIVTARVLGIEGPPEMWEPGAIEIAVRRHAIRDFPLREDEAEGAAVPAGCTPAGVRHILAGCLVNEMADVNGLNYGSLPPIGRIVGDGTARRFEDPDAPALRRLPPHARVPDYDRRYPGAPHYALAKDLVARFLGAVNGNAPSGARLAFAPAAVYEAIGLAIRLFCDEEHSYAEIVADTAATVLAEAGRNRADCERLPRALKAAAARARRMLRAVAPH